jgi:hypothetical protein
MSLVLDFTQPAASVLLAQINHDNGTTVTPDQFRVEEVASLVGDSTGLNTIVYVAATQGAQFEGMDYFKYNRIDIATIPNGRQLTFTRNSALYLSDLLPQINEAWDLHLSAADINDGLLPPSPNTTPVSFMLEITLGSLLWFNEVQIAVTA